MHCICERIGIYTPGAGSNAVVCGLCCQACYKESRTAHTLPDRPEQQYEESRITKPPRKSVNVPFAAGPDGRGAWVAAAGQKLPNKASKVLVVSDLAACCRC